MRFEHRFKCRIFINKLKINFHHISRRSLKSFILLLNLTFVVISTARRINSFEKTSSTYSSLFLSMNVCIVNKSKLNILSMLMIESRIIYFYHSSLFRQVHLFMQNYHRFRRERLKNLKRDSFQKRKRKRVVV